MSDDHSAEVDEPHTRALTEPPEGTPPVVDNPDSLRRSVDALAAGTGPVAIDAERAGGYRYGHRAYLVQLRREGSATHLIDPLPFADLSGLNSALGDAEWILHAASQDIPCLAEIGLRAPSLFDTEVAARLLGRPKVGLAGLAASEFGLTLAKEHSAADWSTRPLPQSWLQYAALDVELLIELRLILKVDLIEAGRWQWAQEEFEYLRTAPAKTPRTDPWRRVAGIHKARSGRQLAIVRELWQQRDQLARDRDIAPGRVLPDKAIAAAALAWPKNRGELEAVAAFQGRGTKRRIAYWWEAVDRALRLPEDRLPNSVGRAPDEPPPPRSWADRTPAAAARLAAARATLTQIADDLQIASESLLTPDSVRRLCWTPPPDLSPTSIDELLAGFGARPWQLSLTVEPLYRALEAAPTQSKDVTATS
ncbi:MAG: HRDC domain-containing protein [Candidatus Nanopelagicales bacterium]